jgi:glycosyltransferase involved in cell wall biosynthesis
VRVGIDGRALASSTQSGVENYVRKLARALAKLDEKPEIIAYTDRALPDRGVEGLLQQGGIETKVIRAPRGWLQVALPWRLWRDRVDLTHLPSTIVPFLVPCPAVVTVHDLAFRHYPQTYSRKDLRMQSRALGSSALRAAHFIAVSENTARDLISLVRIPPERVSVIPLGVSPIFTPDGPPPAADAFPQAAQMSSGYLLHAGGLHPRKNIERLLDAYVGLRADMSLPRLVIVGDVETGWGRRAVQKAQSLGLGDHVIFTGPLPEEVLAALYRGARLVVYPSLYEGFGLPILEGMASGVPVLTSDRSSMPEVAGDAAILVDPESTKEIAEGLKAGLTDERLRENLTAAGLTRSRYYTWELTAKETLGVYERVAAS